MHRSFSMFLQTARFLSMKTPTKYRKRNAAQLSQLISEMNVDDVVASTDPLGTNLSSDPTPYFNTIDEKYKNSESLLLNQKHLYKTDPNFVTKVSTAKSLRLQLNKKRKPKALLEGVRLIKDVLEIDNCKFVSIYANSKESLKKILPIERNVSIHIVPKNMFDLVSDVQHSQGVMAIVEIPEYDNDFNSKSLLILDNIHDPGNMGTLIRSATAFDFKKIISTKGSIWAWEPKVMRSAMGAHFRSSISEHLTYKEIVDELVKLDYNVFLAQNKTEGLEQFSIGPENKLLSKCALVIGSESTGISSEFINALNSSSLNVQNITISMNNNLESLNCSIAGSILMYEINKVLF